MAEHVKSISVITYLSNGMYVIEYLSNGISVIEQWHLRNWQWHLRN